MNYFDNYLSIGFQPIVLAPRSKKPIARKWNGYYNSEVWRSHLELNPDKPYNLGILLGRFVDIESDNEEGNSILSGLIGSIPHPCFRSDRSVHHIFLNPDVNLTVAKFHGIEFRANMVHSVFPPSVHQSGKPYRFLKDSVLEVPPMPKPLLDLYWSNKQPCKQTSKRKPGLKTGFKKTVCNLCGKQSIVHAKRLALEVSFYQSLGRQWSCKKCSDVDPRQGCRNLRNQTRFR